MDISIADERFPSLKHHRTIRALNYYCQVSHVHPRESSQVTKKGVFLVMFTQRGTFGSVWPSREMWLCQNIMFLVLCEKNKPKNPATVCLAWLQNQSYGKSGIATPLEGPAGQPVLFFFPCWITYPNKQTRKEPTKQFLKYSVSGEKRNSDLKQFKVKLCLQTVSQSFTSGRDWWSAW